MKNPSRKTQILELLNDSWQKHSGRPVSGGELAKQLGISRAAVWKQIEELRRSGCPIVALPRLGYWLETKDGPIFPEAVDAALKALEGTEGQGLAKVPPPAWRIEHYLSVPSTNDLAAQMARDGHPEGTVIIAEMQTRGRGRMGRSWHSPGGAGIWMSLILRPSCPPGATAALTLVAAVAVAKAIEGETGLRPGIKWPNDLLLGGRKVCGILTELSAELDRVKHLILGIGVNVNQGNEDFPAELAAMASSLRLELGRYVSRPGLAARILAEFGPRYREFLERGFAGARAEWLERSATLGRDVVITGPSFRIEGTAVDLDPEGALVVKTGEGIIHRITGGEVTLRS